MKDLIKSKFKEIKVNGKIRLTLKKSIGGNITVTPREIKAFALAEQRQIAYYKTAIPFLEAQIKKHEAIQGKIFARRGRSPVHWTKAEIKHTHKLDRMRRAYETIKSARKDRVVFENYVYADKAERSRLLKLSRSITGKKKIDNPTMRGIYDIYSALNTGLKVIYLIVMQNSVYFYYPQTDPYFDLGMKILDFMNGLSPEWYNDNYDRLPKLPTKPSENEFEPDFMSILYPIMVSLGMPRYAEEMNLEI